MKKPSFFTVLFVCAMTAMVADAAYWTATWTPHFAAEAPSVFFPLFPAALFTGCFVLGRLSARY